MPEAHTLVASHTPPRTTSGLLSLRSAAVLLLLCGLALRIFFLRRHAFLAGDSVLYQDIAQNWLHAHVYGLSTDAAPRPTLIRLPAYPAVLAVCAWMFDRRLQADPGTLRSFLPVLCLQILADLTTCWLASRIAWRMLGEKAGLAALAIACLCPFTANYTAVPLTETFTLFCLALAFRALQLWLDNATTRRLVLLAAALSASVLLRPDQGLLGLAVLPILFFANGQPMKLTHRLRPVILCALLAALPFVPWTLRNLHTFGVFQPLAPKLANDPGEVPSRGFQHWYRTWAVDFSSTQDAYWKYPEETVQMADLPTRAFDTPAERAFVSDLLQQTSVTHRLIPQVEQAFDQLATQRARQHPLRTYLLMPAARLVNMLLHPRVEMLPVAERWWQYRAHPSQTVFSWGYALLNLAYLILAAIGCRTCFRSQPAITLSMLAYITLRCALLLTLDNAEQRYTLELFPILFVFASAVFVRPHAIDATAARQIRKFWN